MMYDTEALVVDTKKWYLWLMSSSNTNWSAQPEDLNG